jgi:hypothetical protein
MAIDASRTARLTILVPLGVVLLALVYLVPALWILVAPHGFFHQIGPFGAYNGHYLRDAAALQGGIGLGLAAAVAWPALRAGALTIALAATGLHAINHWVDADAAHAGSNAGVGDAVSLTLLALVAAGLLVLAVRRPAR